MSRDASRPSAGEPGAAEPVTARVRRRLPGEQRRAQIVSAARRLFAEYGFDATTSRQIADAAGVSDALIYRYFSGKQAVLEAVIDAGIARFSALGPPPGVKRRELPLPVLLSQIGRAFLAAVQEQRDLITLLISQHHLVASDTRFVEFIDRAATGLGAVIDHQHPPARDGDHPTPGRGYLLARGFMGSLVAFVLLQHTLDLQAVRPLEAEDYLQAMVTTLVAGLDTTTHTSPGKRP